MVLTARSVILLILVFSMKEKTLLANLWKKKKKKKKRLIMESQILKLSTKIEILTFMWDYLSHVSFLD